MCSRWRLQYIHAGNALKIISITFAGLALYPRVADALDIGYNIGYGMEYSDNIYLADENAQGDPAVDPTTQVAEEYTHGIFAGFQLRENSPALDARLDVNGLYRNYIRDTYPDEVLMGVGANVLWRISPQRFQWVFDDLFTQAPVNSLDPMTPSNRQNTNVLTTGPDYFMRLSPVHTLALSGRYINSYYETSTLNDERYTGNVAWLYSATARTIYSLNYDYLNVNYEVPDPAANRNDYERHDGFVRIDWRTGRNTVTWDLGYTAIDRDESDPVAGRLGRFVWLHRITRNTNFRLNTRAEFSDVNQDLANTSVAVDSLPAGTIVDGDIFYTNRAEAYFSKTGSSFNQDYRALWVRDEYEESPLDNVRWGGNFNLVYTFPSATFSVFLNGDYLVTKYQDEELDRTDREKRAGTGMTYQIISTVSLNLIYRWTDVESIGANPGRSYKENRVLLTISYNSNPRLGSISNTSNFSSSRSR